MVAFEVSVLAAALVTVGLVVVVATVIVAVTLPQVRDAVAGRVTLELGRQALLPRWEINNQLLDNLAAIRTVLSGFSETKKGV